MLISVTTVPNENSVCPVGMPFPTKTCSSLVKEIRRYTPVQESAVPRQTSKGRAEVACSTTVDSGCFRPLVVRSGRECDKSLCWDRASFLFRALFALDVPARALRKKGTHNTTHKHKLHHQLQGSWVSFWSDRLSRGELLPWGNSFLVMGRTYDHRRASV